MSENFYQNMHYNETILAFHVIKNVNKWLQKMWKLMLLVEMFIVARLNGAILATSVFQY